MTRTLVTDAASSLDGIAPPARAEDVRTPSLTAIYDANAAYTFRVLRHLGVAEASLDDAVQDVFMVVLTRHASFEGRSSLRTWIFGIALRVARQYGRARARARASESDVELVSSAPGPEEQHAMADEARVLAELLGTLETSQREVFVLAELEGLTGPEIADALEVKLNTVYSRLRLARARFEESFARHQARERGRLR